MADPIEGGGSNSENIKVTVDGEQAKQAFDRLGEAAKRADSDIDALAASVERANKVLGWHAKANYESQKATEGATTKIRSKTKAVQDATGALDRKTRKVKENSDEVAKATLSFGKFQTAMFTTRMAGVFIWDLAMDGLRGAIGFAESFIERMSAVQRTMSLLATIPGANSTKEFEYLTRVANNYGLSLRSIQDDYAKLNLSAQHTSLTQEQVRKIFEQTSMATRTLHLNTQQTQLTFLALEQMLSKGKVSYEELRKQFAERIPGAMSALAKELGVTEGVLERFITKVGASSEKIVPVLANAVQRMYQGGIQNAATALDAELNRIQTTISVFFKKVSDAGGAEGMARLLKTINNLMQTDKVATVFANAMNKITNQIADFLSTLDDADVEKFANSLIDFFTSVATLATVAAKALIWFGQNLWALGALVGGVAGAGLGMAFGPVGAGIGLVLGSLSGAAGGAAMQGNGASASTELQKKLSIIEQKENELNRLLTYQAEINTPNPGTGIGAAIDNNILKPFQRATTGSHNRQVERLQNELFALKSEIEPILAARALSGAANPINMPTLNDPYKGPPGETPEQMLARLKKQFGLTGVIDDKARRQAEALAARQKNFIEDLQAQLLAITDPDTNKFEKIANQGAQLGIVPGHKDYKVFQDILAALQADYNLKKDNAARERQAAIDQDFKQSMENFQADKAQFAERYATDNLQQIVDSDIVAKTKKMTSQLDKELIALAKKWELERPKMLLMGLDPDEEIRKLRAVGDAYIEEFKRVEEERRTIMGGGKAFLQEWTDAATNYGEITKTFLQGTTQQIEDLLFNLIKNGKFSMDALLNYVIDSMIKIQIQQMMNPWMKAFTQLGTDFMGAMLGSTSSAGVTGSYANPSITQMGARAIGGGVAANMPYWVGERGPELMIPQHSGYIVPTESMKGSGSGSGLNVNIHNYGDNEVQVTESRDDRGQIQMDVQISRIVASQSRRPGSAMNQAIRQPNQMVKR